MLGDYLYSKCKNRNEAHASAGPLLVSGLGGENVPDEIMFEDQLSPDSTDEFWGNLSPREKLNT